jgi:ubiquinone/menaquinone biosynthesis C-methylase UbiE
VIGQLQRAAVWRYIDPLVKSGDRLLDIGCGTGEDAVHYMRRGARVTGIDVSEEMVRVARSRGVQAQRRAIEALSEQSGQFDGAISNFGALNCVRDMENVAVTLGRIIRPDGYLAICVMGACCAWEVGHFLRRGHFKQAFRRWRRGGVRSAMDVHVSYPSVSKICRSFRSQFERMAWYGIGICVPPSYVRDLPEPLLTQLGKIDARIANWRPLRALSDHRLVLFKRL